MMLFAELTDTGMIGGLGGLLTIGVGVYVLIRKTRREQDAADRKVDREDQSENASFWQRQYEEKCRSDLVWQSRVADKMEQLEKRHAKLEADHFICQEEHAQARGQMASLLRDLESKDRRIAELERLVGKI